MHLKLDFVNNIVVVVVVIVVVVVFAVADAYASAITCHVLWQKTKSHLVF